MILTTGQMFYVGFGADSVTRYEGLVGDGACAAGDPACVRSSRLSVVFVSVDVTSVGRESRELCSIGFPFGRAFTR